MLFMRGVLLLVGAGNQGRAIGKYRKESGSGKAFTAVGVTGLTFFAPTKYDNKLFHWKAQEKILDAQVKLLLSRGSIH